MQIAQQRAERIQSVSICYSNSVLIVIVLLFQEHPRHNPVQQMVPSQPYPGLSNVGSMYVRVVSHPNIRVGYFLLASTCMVTLSGTLLVCFLLVN